MLRFLDVNLPRQAVLQFSGGQLWYDPRADKLFSSCVTKRVLPLVVYCNTDSQLNVSAPLY